MNKRLNQFGIASWELVLGLLVVAVIAFAGYHVHKSSQPVSSSTTASTSPATASTTTASVPTAPVINKASDLNTAENTLNQVDPSSSNTSDSNQLSSQASGL